MHRYVLLYFLQLCDVEALVPADVDEDLDATLELQDGLRSR